ncbi:hypothetical protein PRIC2_006764 [Phytophthora ramorum]
MCCCYEGSCYEGSCCSRGRGGPRLRESPEPHASRPLPTAGHERTRPAADINAPAGTAKLVEATTAVLSRDLESSFLFFEDEEAPSKPRMAEKNAKAQEAVAEAATENGISARLVVKCHIALVKCVDKLVVVEDFVQGCHHRFIVA